MFLDWEAIQDALGRARRAHGAQRWAEAGAGWRELLRGLEDAIRATGLPAGVGRDALMVRQGHAGACRTARMASQDPRGNKTNAVGFAIQRCGEARYALPMTAAALTLTLTLSPTPANPNVP